MPVRRSPRLATKNGRVLLVLLVLLASCGRPAPLCAPSLREAGVTFASWNQGSASSACTVTEPVRVVATRLAFARPLDTSCAAALAWAKFEPQVLAIALRELRQPVTGVTMYGSWSCRPMTGNSRRMSLHATARALDVAGFTLADGSTVTVKRDWHDRGPRGRFLRALFAAACRQFSVVLNPDSDRYHFDHIHMDIGPFKACG